jgi:hypothetical protein
VWGIPNIALPVNSQITFFGQGISGGGGVGGVGSIGSSTSSFLLQPGTYQVQVFAGALLGCGGSVEMQLNSQTLAFFFPDNRNIELQNGLCNPNDPNFSINEGSLAAYRILFVGNANSSLTFLARDLAGVTSVNFNDAFLILTQLQ